MRVFAGWLFLCLSTHTYWQVNSFTWQDISQPPVIWAIIALSSPLFSPFPSVCLSVSPPHFIPAQPSPSVLPPLPSLPDCFIDTQTLRTHTPLSLSFTPGSFLTDRVLGRCVMERGGWGGVWESPWRSLIEQTTGKDWGEKTFNLVIWVQIKGMGNVFVVDFKAIFDLNDGWYNHYQHLSFLLEHRLKRLQENLEIQISSTLCIHNYSSCKILSLCFRLFLTL